MKLIEKVKGIPESCHHLTKLPFNIVFHSVGLSVINNADSLKLTFLIGALLLVSFFCNIMPQYKSMNIPGEISLFIVMVYTAKFVADNGGFYTDIAWMVYSLILFFYFPIAILSFLYILFYKD